MPDHSIYRSISPSFHGLNLALNTSPPRRSTIPADQNVRRSCSKIVVVVISSIPGTWLRSRYHMVWSCRPPCKMLLYKIFQRHQAQPPAQGSPPSASEEPESAYPMSRTAQWVAQQAQQEFQLVHRGPHQAYQTYQPSTVQEAQHAPRRRHRPPLMDLSSLEGPPIEDSRLLSRPHSMIPPVCEEPATPNHTPHCLLWKPLPPRPASAEPQSWRLQRYRSNIPPTENNIDHLRNDAHLRPVPAQRNNMRSPDGDEMPPDRHHHPSGERPRSPHSAPHQQPGRPRRRSLSSGALVWLEDEEQWVVAHPRALRGSSHPPVTRLPTRLRNATTRPVRRYADMRDVSEDDMERRDYPPDYESHQFSPTHVQRLTYGPASRPRASAWRSDYG